MSTALPMNRPARRRKRLTEAQGFALVEAWKESGRSVEQFCTERGIRPERLDFWRRRQKRAKGDARSRDVVVIPFDVGREPEVPVTAMAPWIEIAAPVGLVVRVPLNVSRQLIGEVLRVVHEVVR